MSHSDTSVDGAAARIADAYRLRKILEPGELQVADITHAYAIQNRNTREWIAAGRRVIGRKIGLTSLEAQKQFGSREPMDGRLFADMEILDGSTVPFSSLFSPRAEGEVAFVLSRDLVNPDPGIADIIRAIDFALPAIEIVDTRYGRWDVGVSDAIADNGAAGLFVLGAQPVNIRSVDLKLCGMSLSINGEPLSTGAGLACLGHPLNAVRWLARKAAAEGDPLREGDVILSGALGPMVPLSAGAHVSLAISGIGSVDVILTGETEVSA